MARNRIAALNGAGPPAAAPTQPSVASAEPVASPDRNAEAGTVETEKALKLTPADEKEIQQRLIVLNVYKGAASGVLDSPTRSAIAEWQKSHGFAPTAFLGPTQLAALRGESEDGYQKLLAAQPAPKQPPRQAVKPVTRAAKAPAKPPAHAPARHVAGPRAGGPPQWLAPFATGVGAGLLMGHIGR